MRKYIVYQTTNLINNKIYIGVHVTNNSEKFDGYLGCGININSPYFILHPKTPFQYAVKKYGTDAFKRTTLKVFNTKEEALKLENERLKKLEDSYHYIQSQIENTANEIKSNAKYEADLIIREAKENASSIVNDALLRAEKLENDKENLNQSLKMYKRKVKNALMEQLEIIDEIEVL